MNMKKFKRFFSRAPKGRAAVEFSLVFLIMIFVFLGIIEFGRLFQVWLTIQWAAQDGARYAATGQQSVDPTEDLWDTARLQAIKDVVKLRAGSLTIDDAAEADRTFDMLMGSSVPPRRRFIQTHAKEVRNLDV